MGDKNQKRDGRIIILLAIVAFVIGYNCFFKNLQQQDNQTVFPSVLSIENNQLQFTNSPKNRDITDQIPVSSAQFFFEKISINHGSKEQLMMLQGIGPKMADRIIQFREVHGAIRDKTDLMKIPGIGPQTYEKLRDSITFMSKPG